MYVSLCVFVCVYLSSIPKLYIVSTLFAQFYSIFMVHTHRCFPFKIFKFDIQTGQRVRFGVWLLSAQLCNGRSCNGGGEGRGEVEGMNRCMPGMV